MNRLVLGLPRNQHLKGSFVEGQLDEFSLYVDVIVYVRWRSFLINSVICCRVVFPMIKDVSDVYSQEAYYGSYKSVRNKLRKFLLPGVFYHGLAYLHAPAKDNVDYLKRQPWVVLLLFKWALLENDSVYGRRNPTAAEIHALLQLVFDLGNSVRMPDEYEHYNLFFRALGYQQFIYQRDTTVVAIGRQFFYFADLPDNHYLCTKFLEITGIEIRRFLELSQVLLVRFFTKEERKIDVKWFSSLSAAYPEIEVQNFLELLSMPLGKVREFLLMREKLALARGENPRAPSEYYEQSVFINFPFLRMEDEQYLCVEHHLLFRCIERYIYNSLRANCAIRFMEAFGPLFERYVEKAILYTGISFIDEAGIERALGKRQGVKLIDFVIAEGDANIFIDAKAVEMSDQGKVVHQSAALTKWLKNSALKAIKQAHSVLHALPDLADDFPIKPRDENYLITVTYSELYVGTGRMLAESIGANAVQEIWAEIPEGPRIPFERMYFVTIQEFEQLCEAVHSKQTTLKSVLDYATNADADAHSRKFEFGQHIDAMGLEVGPPEYVKARTFLEIDKVAGCLQTS